MNVETFRIVQILPLLLLLTAWGLQSLLSFTPSGKRLPLLLLVFSLSLLLDGIRLVQPYADDSKPRFPEVWPIKSMESYRAYHLMWFMSHRNGPGLVFADFDPDSLNDPVLSVAAYPFNADGNPEIPVERAHWAALFVNTHYVPFLTRRFPKAKWYWVGQDQNSEDGGKALVIIPFTAQNQGTLCQWVGVHSIFRAADFVRFWQNQQDIPAILAILGKAYPLLKGDPFLESVYWEKTAAYEYENNENLDYDAHLHALRMAVQKGYPSAHLYFKLGLLLMAKNHFPEARQAFEKASHCAFNQTPSTQLLKMVNQMEKQHLSMETLYHLNR
jgi:hypothetical protein